MPSQALQDAVALARSLRHEALADLPPVHDGVIYLADPSREVLVRVEPMRRSVRGFTQLTVDGKGWWVVLNAGDSRPRQRFTLAHETWHILCGTGIAFRRDGFGEYYECSVADHFASELLIPADWLERHVHLRASEVALRCNVTLAAAATAIRKRDTH